MNRVLLDRVLYGFDREVCAWVGERIPDFTASLGARALGVVDPKTESLVAGVVYDGWNGVHVQASIAADGRRWASRGTMFKLFHYPFGVLGCEAISVLIAQTNLKSLNLATSLGFEVEAIVGLAAHDGSNLLVLKMFKDRCGWLSHGWEEQQGAGGT